MHFPKFDDEHFDLGVNGFTTRGQPVEDDTWLILNAYGKLTGNKLDIKHT